MESGEWHLYPHRKAAWTVYSSQYNRKIRKRENTDADRIPFVGPDAESRLRSWLAKLPRGQFVTVDWGRGHRETAPGRVPPDADPRSPGQGRVVSASGPLPRYLNAQ